ncbi:expansin EXLX1 family cellulose-binding protein [Nocardia altamirensis]|uniref:expansin EXLX1 family cellulose-binding protein n=1 Tax=Nocardia altamirensis TaxID=472158 RepID=UPI000840723D|nr:expansin EXLX1 family cellulose-binding protein [Nocardia altamirensis]
MHRIPINQRHFRSGWLWTGIGLVAIAGAAVWLTRPEPVRCDARDAMMAQSATSRTPAVTMTFGPLTTSAPPPQPVVSGEARYYAFSSGVACSFPGLPLDGFYVGMSTPEYGTADPCGAFLDIQGPHGDVRAQIVDRCPGCAPGQLDLSKAAFDQIADPVEGVAKVRYSVVRNPEPPSELSYQVKPDSTSVWFSMLVSGAGNPLREVTIRPAAGGAWQTLSRGMDNYWSITGAGAGPFAARITDVHGNQAEIQGITLDAGARASGARLYTGEPLITAPISPPPPITSPTTLAAAPRPQPDSELTAISCKP